MAFGFTEKRHVCRDCGGTVIPIAKDGRFYTYHEVWILVPSNIEIPRCLNCGEDWLSDEGLKELDGVLEASFKEHEGLIRAILRQKV